MYDAPFHERLQAARELLAAVAQLPPASTSITDQANATKRDASEVFQRAGGRLRTEQPQRWSAAELAPGPDAAALCVAAIGSCRTCPHLQEQPLQPSVAALVERRHVCRRCAATVVGKAVADGLCDVCERETEEFHGILLDFNGCVVIGDACPDCASIVGVPTTRKGNDDMTTYIEADPAAEREHLRAERIAAKWHKMTAYRRAPLPPREPEVVGCMVCGIAVRKRAAGDEGRLRISALRASGRLCQPCDTALRMEFSYAEAIAVRARAEKAPFARKWRPRPSAINVIEGRDSGEYDLPADWRACVWATHVQRLRALGKPDPRPVKVAFSWVDDDSGVAA